MYESIVLDNGNEVRLVSIQQLGVRKINIQVVGASSAIVMGKNEFYDFIDLCIRAKDNMTNEGMSW